MGAWWDVTQWGSAADWGVAAWAEDVVAAYEQALDWAIDVATQKEWGDEWHSVASGIFDDAADASKTAADFWVAVYRAWEHFDAAAAAAGVEGWDSLGAVFASAAGASYTVSQAREDGSLLGLVSGAVEATGAELAAAADPSRSVWPWLVGGVAVAGLWVFLRGGH